MIALGRVRKGGLILISIVSLGLFAFITEEGFRSREASRGDRRQQTGEVLGEKVNVRDFQKLIDEYSEVVKMQQGVNNLNEMQLNQMRDVVWQTYIQTKVAENEANRLGLTVVDAKLQNILDEGTNPILTQTPFVNQQTGHFDVNLLKKFLVDYRTQQTTNPQLAEQYQTLYKYWTFVEKTPHQQLLAQKYQNLLTSCILSNPVEVKMAYKEANKKGQIELAALPCSSIEDSRVKISDADLKAKYEEAKGRFKQYVEGRNIKYVTVQMAPSANDRVALQESFTKYTTDLVVVIDPANTIRKGMSLAGYSGLPVAKTAYAADTTDRLGSVTAGQIFGPFESQVDNMLNIIKLVSKQLLPGSVQYHRIQVMGMTADEAQKRVDSIYAALNGGADPELLAKKYGQTGEKI